MSDVFVVVRSSRPDKRRPEIRSCPQARVMYTLHKLHRTAIVIYIWDKILAKIDQSVAEQL